MCPTCLFVPWLIAVYSRKSPLQKAAGFNFCDEARRLGAARTGVRFSSWPGCTGREPPWLQLATYPWSKRFEKGLADSRRSFHLLAIRKEQMSFPQEGQ
jgi:hypothetical protein